MTDISGKCSIGITAGTQGVGNKSECSLAYKLGNFTLKANGEFKGGLDQDLLDGEKLRFADLYLRSPIARPQFGFPVIKGVELDTKIGDVEVALGWLDLLRASTTLKELGFDVMNDVMRTPFAYFVERPLLHTGPGSNPGVSVKYTAQSDDKSLRGRLFAGVTGSRASGGIFGIQQKDYSKPENKVKGIMPAGESDPKDVADPFWQGAYYGLGGGISYLLGDVRLGVDASLWIKTFGSVADKKKAHSSSSKDSDAVIMPYVAWAMDVGKRIHLAGDMSWINDTGSDKPASFSWRAGVVGDIITEGNFTLSALAFAGGVSVPGGAKVTDDQIYYENSGDTVVITPEGPVTIPGETIAGKADGGTAFVVGPMGSIKLGDKSALDWSLNLGLVMDTRIQSDLFLLSAWVNYKASF